METTLHQQLKEAYSGRGSQQEFRLGRYRIDVKEGPLLIEIQTSGLSSISRKVQTLLKDHPVQVVKPLIHRKRLVKMKSAEGPVVSRRWSPKRESWLDLFNHLIYFTRVFPHRRLKLTVPLIEIEEWRYPGHGRRRRWRKTDHQVRDQHLVEIVEDRSFSTVQDLNRLLGRGLKKTFDTGELAKHLEIERFEAQRIAYCLRKTGAARQVGKKGNALLYQLATRSQRCA